MSFSHHYSLVAVILPSAHFLHSIHKVQQRLLEKEKHHPAQLYSSVLPGGSVTTWVWTYKVLISKRHQILSWSPFIWNFVIASHAVQLPAGKLTRSSISSSTFLEFAAMLCTISLNHWHSADLIAYHLRGSKVHVKRALRSKHSLSAQSALSLRRQAIGAPSKAWL